MDIDCLRFSFAVYRYCNFVCAWQRIWPDAGIKEKVLVVQPFRRRQEVQLLWPVITQVPRHTIQAVFRWAVHRTDKLSAAVCYRDFYRCLTVGSAPLWPTGIFFYFIRKPVGDHRAAHWIRSHISAAGKAVFAPVVPIHGRRQGEQMEVAARYFSAAFFQWGDVIHYEQAASVRSHHQIM